MQVPNQLHTCPVTRSSPWQLVAGSLARQRRLVRCGWADRLPLPTEHGQARQEGLRVCQDPHPAAPGGAAADAAGMLLLQVRALGWGTALCVFTASRRQGGGKGRDLWQGRWKGGRFPEAIDIAIFSLKLCFNCLNCENRMY